MILSAGKEMRPCSWVSSCPLLSTFCSPFLIAVVSPLMVFIGQMGVGLHRRDDTGMAEPLLDKFPVDGLPILQVEASESGRVGVPQNVRMEHDSRSVGAILKHLLDG